MISLHAMEGSAPVVGLFETMTDAMRISLFLDHADFCGYQEDGKGGRFELWTLRKAIPGHPKGSTVARSTLEAYLFPSVPGGAR